MVYLQWQTLGHLLPPSAYTQAQLQPVVSGIAFKFLLAKGLSSEISVERFALRPDVPCVPQPHLILILSPVFNSIKTRG
jgi:hypothetical protein